MTFEKEEDERDSLVDVIKVAIMRNKRAERMTRNAATSSSSGYVVDIVKDMEMVMVMEG